MKLSDYEESEINRLRNSLAQADAGYAFVSPTFSACEQLLAVIDRLTAAEQVRAPKWQPIDTAPKDGTKVLLFGLKNKRSVYEVDWFRKPEDNLGFIGWGRFNTEYWPPTHWQPLSEPPLA